MAQPMKPILMNLSLVPFLSEYLPKYISDKICAKLNEAINNPISKIESVTPFAIMGMNTNTIEIPAC